jgi:hypothetical protein
VPVHQKTGGFVQLSGRILHFGRPRIRATSPFLWMQRKASSQSSLCRSDLQRSSGSGGKLPTCPARRLPTRERVAGIPSGSASGYRVGTSYRSRPRHSLHRPAWSGNTAMTSWHSWSRRTAHSPARCFALPHTTLTMDQGYWVSWRGVEGWLRAPCGRWGAGRAH